MGKKFLTPAKNVLDPGEHFFNKRKDPAPAEAPAATVMPTPDDEAVKAARRRKVAEMQNRGGRGSTFMSEDRLGG